MRRRGFVLIAVLVIVSIALLVATGVLFIVQGRAADAAGSADMAQSRALAWSGLQAVMSELNSQRERFLAGESPRLDRQYSIYETHNRIGAIRLVPVGSGDSLLAAEAGKIDLSSADAERLTKTGMIDAGVAAAIINYRDQVLRRPFQSVAELLHVPGGVITPQTLYGPIDQIKPRDQAQLAEGDLAERVAERLQAPATSLSDVLTVFSVEPNVQRNGEPRINLNQPWTEAFERELTEKLGKRAADQFKGMAERGVRFENESKIVATLRGADIPLREWAGALDMFTATPGEHCFSRIDINTAPLEAIMTLPTLTPEQAAQIVNRRETLTADERASITWPVTSGIVLPEALEQLAGTITTRCWVYRVRIAAGEIVEDDVGSENGPMINPVIWEAVIDLSSPQPRVAYLRDISVLQAAAQIALEATLSQPSDFEPQSEEAVDSAAADESPADEEPAEAEDESADPAESNDSAEAKDDQAKEAAPTTQPQPKSRRRIGRWIGGGS